MGRGTASPRVPPSRFPIWLGQGTHIYPGTHPNTVFVQSPGQTAVTSTGTNPNEVNADISLTMMHHASSSASRFKAAFLRTQPLNSAPPSAMQLTKVRFFLSIQKMMRSSFETVAMRAFFAGISLRRRK